MEFDEHSNRVIDCAIEVHRHLGLGLLESAYEQCLAHELSRGGIGVHDRRPNSHRPTGFTLSYRRLASTTETALRVTRHAWRTKTVHAECRPRGF